MVRTIAWTFLAGLVATASPPSVPTTIDLTAPFHTRAPWHFTATQGPEIANSYGPAGDMAPGKFTLCLSHDGKSDCDSSLLHVLGNALGDDWSGPHFLKKAEIDRPDARPLLLIQSAGLWSGDGDYGIETVAYRYDRAQDRFVVAYEHGSEHNRNGNVRYIADGPLRGDFISADATDDAPFGYWMVVNRLGADDAYHQILRYRSATHYGDNNPLAVIDSEMPNIEEHLHLWHPSQALPLPAGKCPKPHLAQGALWCQ